ncbi:MAG: hypothetical protein AAF327_01820 [Cyanobacteria bacterium P01_A01_bin.37]
MSNGNELMAWEEVEPVAKHIFNVWRSGGDFEWAKQAWKALSTAGLTSYGNELERCQIALRFLALADYYYDFCTTYRDEYLEIEFLDWAENLPISAFRLGQILGQPSELDDEWDLDSLYQKALKLLVERYGNEVIKALEEGWGDRCLLMVSLWRSSLSEEQNTPDHPDYLTDQGILYQPLPSGAVLAQNFEC